MDMHGNAWKCIEMHGNAMKSRQMQENASKCMELHGNAGKCNAMQGNAGKCKKVHGNALKCMEMQGNAGHGKINISALHGATGWLPMFALVRCTPVKSRFSVAGGPWAAVWLPPCPNLPQQNRHFVLQGGPRAGF